MKNSKQLIGLLNSTLTGITITTGEPVTSESAKLIMKGILISIPSYSAAKEFTDYCLEEYSIKLKN